MMGNTPMRSLLQGLVEFLRWYRVKFKVYCLVDSFLFGQRRKLHTQHFGECVTVNDDTEVCTIVPEHDLKSLPGVFFPARHFNIDVDAVT